MLETAPKQNRDREGADAPTLLTPCLEAAALSTVALQAALETAPKQNRDREGADAPTLLTPCLEAAALDTATAEPEIAGIEAAALEPGSAETSDDQEAAWEPEGPTALELLAAFEHAEPLDSAPPAGSPFPEPGVTNAPASPAFERAAARREGILRLLAAMYPEAAPRITGQGRHAAPVTPRRPASDGFVVFQLAGESFALGLSQVLEADRVPAFTPVPFVPEFVRGVTNRRGDVLPLIDLRLLLGLEPGPNAGDGRMLVVRRNESDPPAALIVDGLGGIAWLDRLLGVRLSSHVAGRFPELLRGSGQHRDSTVHVLDLERLFARQQLKELEELTAAL